MAANPQTVLVVDDDEMWRMLARLALERAGCCCVEAESVVRALDLLASRQVDTIVTDLRMPDADGMELCRRVRGDPRLAQIPIIVMTSSTDPLEHRTVMEAGADLTLRKNSEFKQVVSAVRFARRSAPS